jgi:pimeloyl-ACP methyl ester carboxylesterase
VAQLGARLDGIEEVVGSNPIGSTRLPHEKYFSVRSDLLEIVYEEGGAPTGPKVLLLHGWPDDVRGWRAVAARLLGYRTFTPYLRGRGLTRFRSADTLRDGRGVALAQDAIDFADAQGLTTFAVAGHDWGARAAYTLAALFPHRVTHIVGIALAYQPRGVFELPPFPQARRFWYQWYMNLDQGAGAVRADPKGFARIQWEVANAIQRHLGSEGEIE